MFSKICALFFLVAISSVQSRTVPGLEKYGGSLLNQLSNDRFLLKQRADPLPLLPVKNSIESGQEANQIGDDRIYQRPVVPTEANGQPLDASSKAQRALESKFMRAIVPANYGKTVNQIEQKPFGFMKDHAFLVNDYYGFGSFSKDVVVVHLNWISPALLKSWKSWKSRLKSN